MFVVNNKSQILQKNYALIVQEQTKLPHLKSEPLVRVSAKVAVLQNKTFFIRQPVNKLIIIN